MKCPKCGYNSFEFHDACQKCSHGLAGYKATYGLRPIVIPQAARVVMAAHVVETALDDHHESTEADQTADMFSFDLPDEIDDGGAVAATPLDDPFDFTSNETETSSFGEFSFDDEPAQEPIATSAAPGEDAFASLLETADDPFALQDAPPAPVAPAAKDAVAPGEFDLDSFSWDEPAPGDPKPEDDFNDLFGADDEKK